MSKFVIVGSGAIGSSVATQLADMGHDAVIVTRRGTGPDRSGVTRVAADASDLTRLGELSKNAAALFNCANPQYHRWPTDWPPIANSLLGTAISTGATLVTVGNLYAYGKPNGQMTPHDPLVATYEKAQVRATMWRDALAAQEAGRAHVVEVRASDFIGANSNTIFAERVIPKLLKNRTVQAIGNPDSPHSWTYVNDVATNLVAAALDPTSWGRAWHAPTNPARSQREVVLDLADEAGVPHVEVKSLSRTLLRVAGIFSPLIRELPKTMYQFEGPFVIDDSETREHFGLAPTPWHDVLANALSPFMSQRELTAI